MRFGAWLGAAVALLLALVGVVLELAGGTGLEADEAFSFAYVLIAGPVGALVASRHRRNPIGWILVGLTVWAGVDAFGDWNREPFTSESTKHISVWEKLA